MNCLITGGLGFLGTHITKELLQRGHTVTVYDIEAANFNQSKNCKIVKGDVRDYDHLVSHLDKNDVVFHMSGLLGTSELFENPREAINTNIHGALNVILGCNKVGIKRILIPTKPNEWHNVYSATSLAIQKLGLSYSEYIDMDIRVLKFWNVYGPYQKTHPIRKAIPLFIIQALENRPIEIFGDGSQEIELIFSKDFSKIAVDFTLYSGKIENEIYEIHSSIRLTILEIAHIIIKISGSKSEIKHIPMRIGEKVGTSFHRNQDIKTVIDLKPETEITIGLERTIDFYKSISKNKRQKILKHYGDKAEK
ncbi:NAD-dependent epimerase/dehydratase family protein [Muricauda sp. CAU 1633]|uniref:NAD-dependent epimerase/dehydratase family protein n=1 Tax=Allomuricauda sp. CAU 1633 TaxID=2816036 RepID=UPI001A8C9AFA|nr:NAD-dependent epimerase/dehydratase family protein [Muricauda sp. CAU 1633]MBO0324293.1 NAD-dependent epimerase/dehydratase family protein [Muricauda sp. CAU 1633]